MLLSTEISTSSAAANTEEDSCNDLLPGVNGSTPTSSSYEDFFFHQTFQLKRLLFSLSLSFSTEDPWVLGVL
jgi:hypothetical protein